MTNGASEVGGGTVGVRLWLLPGDADSRRRLCMENASVLCDEERAAVRAAKRPALAERLFSSRILLRLALARCLRCGPGELRFERLASGRLALVAPVAEGVSFNLSHAGSESVVAVSAAGAVGVDVEAIGRAGAALRIAETLYPVAEYHEIAADAEPALCALQHWTLKECVVKTLGQPVWDGLRRFRFSFVGDRICMSEGASEDPPGWRLALGMYPRGYVLAVALQLPVEDFRPAIFRLEVLGDGMTNAAGPFPTRLCQAL